MLDLFAGRPSLEKMQLWADEGVFTDPLTIAKGRKQYEAQWVSDFPFYLPPTALLMADSMVM